MLAKLLRQLAALSLDDLDAVRGTLSTFTTADWVQFAAFEREQRTQPHPADDIILDCTVCADDAYWADNGGKIARWLACGPLGLGCSGF